MGNRLWEYRSATAAKEGLQSAWYFHEGVFQCIQCNSQGEIVLHIIEETHQKPSVSDIPEMSHAEEMVLSSHFELVPKPFGNAGIPGFDGPITHKELDGDLNVSYGHDPSSKSFHIVTPLYLQAKSLSAKNPFLVYCYVRNARCFVLLFKNGICEMANAYPAANESEVMYFCIAAAKKSEFDLKQTRFLVLGHKPAALLQSFERFRTDALPARVELPYPAGEYPPYAAESFLLYQYLTCALPAEI